MLNSEYTVHILIKTTITTFNHTSNTYFVIVQVTSPSLNDICTLHIMD